PQREQANQERERHFQDLAASVRAWTRQRIENVQNMIRGFKRTTTQTIRRYRSTIETAGTNAIRAARNWAEDRKLQGRSWWERIVATLSRWFSNSQEVNEQWEVRRTQQTRDGIASDLTIVNQIHVQVQQGVTQQQLLQKEGLTAEQRAIIQEYFAQQGTRHPLDVAAACLRQRLASNHRAQALPVFERELIAKPDEEFEKLNAVGRAMRPGFDCAQIAQDVHAAMDQIGTDEAAIYNSLQGLNAIQGAAVRKVYRIRYPDPHGRDLDQMLREELSGEELDRAQLQLEGRSATADAVALHDAMGLLNTDEAAIMDLLRGRSQAEIDAIRAEYETRFDEPLDVALNDGLDEGNEQDQASALLCGDRATADSIALDEAMRGGVFGWGTSEEEIESTYQRVRNEVQAQAEQEGWNSQQMEAEIRRRSQAIEARFNERYANVEQYNAPGLEGESVLRRAITSEMNPGPERDLANALADNDMLEADMARIEIERRSVYASDETINNVLRSQYERSLQATRLDQGPARRMTIQRQLDEIVRNNRNITEEELSSHRFRLEHQMQRDMEGEAQRRSCISMDALQNAYSERHGLPLSLVLAFNMSGNDYSRARAMLRQGGRLTPLQEIEYATRGLGTDEDAIRNRITGMTRAEIQELRQQWELRHPGQCFNDMLRGELSGRDESDIMDMVERGAPESAMERIAQERSRMERELDDLTGVLGGVAAGSEDAWLRRQMRELDDLEPRLRRTDLEPEERIALRDELDMRVQRVEEAVKDHRRAIDSVTDTATQIVGLVVGITVGAALTVLSGGLLGPVMIAVLASVAATLATMGTKQLIQGGSYGGEEIGVDLAVGVVDALTAVATAGMGGRILRGAGGAAQRAIRPTQATRLAGRLSQSALGQRIGRLRGVQGIRSGMSRLNQLETGVLTRGITGQNPLARNSQNMRIMAELMAEGIENAVSAAPAAFVQTALTDETWEGNVALNLLQGTAMGVGTGVLMGGVMQGAGHLYHGARGRIRLSTPEGRLMEANRILGESFQGFRERHPDASYFDFLSHADGMRAQAEVQERGLLPGAEPS
ncbi:hypothetical protein KAR10_00995, partial [bacterium]|nr:hypothetical protein [bacterium]